MDSNKSGKTGSKKPVIGITIGDINGIGPEVIIKSLLDIRVLNQLTPVIYGSTKTLSYYRKSLNLYDFNFTPVKEDGTNSSKRVNVINCWDDVVEIKAGEVTQAAGECSRMALEKVAEALKQHVIDAVVTAPINKSNIYSDKFQFKGHTEFFDSKFGQGNSMMMMVSENLKIGLVTDHIPLSEVAGAITEKKLALKLSKFEKSLMLDFGISKPKIAVLGLNPHAGEEGLLGSEEKEIIIPVIKDFKHKGKLVFGPYSSDGFFGNRQYKQYDGILCMYHDQGLIPFKCLSFDTGVNYTAGINIVRTSPDHGTANSIAGKNLASEKSMREALFLACDIVKHREEEHIQKVTDFS